MSEQQKKSRFGGISAQRERYATLGGGARREAPEHRGIQESERSDVQTSGRQVEASERQEVQTSERSDVHMVDQAGDAGQVEGKARKRRTVYLELANDRWIRHRVADTDEEISDVVNKAIAFYRAHAQ
jgi:hypothetical protein